MTDEVIQTNKNFKFDFSFVGINKEIFCCFYLFVKYWQPPKNM